MAPPVLQRKPHTQPAQSSNSKPLRSASSHSTPGLKSASLAIGLTLVLSFFVLRQLDIFSSGEWPESERIRYLLSDKDRKDFREALKSETTDPLVLTFYSETCLACRGMRSHLLSCAEQLEGVPFYAAPVADAKNINLAKEFDIERIPAILVLNPNGPKSSPKLYKGKPNTQQLVDFVKTATASKESGG